MKPILRVITPFLLALLLSGCKEKQSYSYYMRHPLVLQQEILECKSGFEKSKEQAAQCEMVIYAGLNLSALINQQQQDPEKFGQRILEAQEKYVKLKEVQKQARQTLADLSQKKASPAELRAAQEELYKAKKASADQLQEIRVLLAVIGMGSPE